MDYALAPCPYCACGDVRITEITDCRLCAVKTVSAYCVACGARGPVRTLGHGATEDAVFALAADDWNDVAELIHTAPTVRIESAHVGLTDADKAELDRIAASIKEPATDLPDARGDAAQGSNEASDTSGGPDGSTQVPETAGGGGSEGATKITPQERPAVEFRRTSPAANSDREAGQPRPDPASNGADRGGAAVAKPKGKAINKQADEADRLRRFLKREGLSQSAFAKMSGASQPGVSALVRGAYVSPKERRRIAAFLNAADSLDDIEALSASPPSNEAAKSDRRKSNGPRRHPIAERIEAYLTRTGQSVWSGLFSVADQTVYNILHGSMPKAPTIEKLRRELDQLERDEVLANQPIDESKIERLPNNYDELNTGVNPLPKHEAPPRCAETP